MKKIILIFSLLIAVAYTQANTTINKSNINIDLNEKESTTFNEINNINIQVSIVSNGNSCTVTLTGSIGYGSSYMAVNISVTSETCEDAENQAWASLARQYKRMQDFYDER